MPGVFHSFSLHSFGLARTHCLQIMCAKHCGKTVLCVYDSPYALFLKASEVYMLDGKNLLPRASLISFFECLVKEKEMNVNQEWATKTH